jgi:hypothetical protein
VPVSMVDLIPMMKNHRFEKLPVLLFDCQFLNVHWSDFSLVCFSRHAAMTQRRNLLNGHSNYDETDRGTLKVVRKNRTIIIFSFIG